MCSHNTIFLKRKVERVNLLPLDRYVNVSSRLFNQRRPLVFKNTYIFSLYVVLMIGFSLGWRGHVWSCSGSNE